MTTVTTAQVTMMTIAMLLLMPLLLLTAAAAAAPAACLLQTLATDRVYRKSRVATHCTWCSSPVRPPPKLTRKIYWDCLSTSMHELHARTCWAFVHSVRLCCKCCVIRCTTLDV